MKPIEDAVFRADGLMYQAKNRKNTVITELNADDENIPAEKSRKAADINCGRFGA